MSDPANSSAGSGFDFNRPTIVGLLYLASYVTGITGLVGVVLAYIWRGEAHQPWEATHYTYLIRTFWISVVASILGIVTVIVGVGFLILGLIGIWWGVRSVMSLISAQKREPMKDPETLLF